MENRIRQLREAKGLTQEGLADLVDVTRQTIISLEKGKYESPSVKLAHRIARALGAAIEQVFIFNEEDER